MTDKFIVAADQLMGCGLTFDISALTSKKCDDRDDRLVEICESIYRQGRESVMLSYDDRFDLQLTVETLRALAVIVGPLTGERHCRAAAALARLLQEQVP